MAIFDFFKRGKTREKNLPESEVEPKTIEAEDDEEWEDLLPTLKPIPLENFDSIDMLRKRDDEVFAKKYKLRTVPLQGYDVI